MPTLLQSSVSAEAHVGPRMTRSTGLGRVCLYFVARIRQDAFPRLAGGCRCAGPWFLGGPVEMGLEALNTMCSHLAAVPAAPPGWKSWAAGGGGLVAGT